MQEGDTYTIPAGYHNGSGTVSGVAGGGNYSLQSKTCTPTKSQQSITPDSGYYGISDVTVAAIPEAYQNVSGVTATAGEVLSGKVIVDATGATITGTMPNNGAVNQTLTTASGHTSYTVPAGYHNGSGTVKIVTETKTVTPADSSQDVTPTTGKVLSKVTVGPIPSNYGNTTGDDAVAANILSGKKAHSNDDGDAVALTGTMANNGAVSQTLDATTGNQSYTVPAGYHNGSGAVNIVLETKSATPTTASQDVTPTAGKVLSKVTVNAIPSQYKDTSTADAVAADVLEDKIFVNGTGPVTGTMTNNGAVSASLDATTGNQSYTIPAGYHNGSGTVTITLETKQTTPTTGTQYISPTNGKVLSRVTVNPIPDWFGDIRHDDAEASHIL